MRYLGIDYGTTIGLAISDESGQFAFPLESMSADGTELAHIVALCKERHIGAIVIGDTRALNGAPNRITGKSDSFAEALERATSIPVHRQQEAWSSVEAARFAPKNDMHNDAAAAAIILQRFLETAHT